MTDETQPLVSVIIPFYNEERFLEEALASVLHQTYTNWEALLIDDGSADGSTALAKSYAARYADRFFYIEHEGHQNKGLSATRNAGIAQARGRLIALLDADDVWLPQKLEKQVRIFAENQGIALLCESSMYWQSWHPQALYTDAIKPVGAPGNRVYHPPQLFLHLYPLGRGAAPCPSGLMLKRDALRKHGDFEESFKGLNQMYEDQPLLAKFYLNEAVYVSADCNNQYRLRVGSLVQHAKSSGKYEAVRRFFLLWLQQYLTQTGNTNPQVHKAVQKALWKLRYPKLRKLARMVKQKLVRPPQPKI